MEPGSTSPSTSACSELRNYILQGVNEIDGSRYALWIPLRQSLLSAILEPRKYFSVHVEFLPSPDKLLPETSIRLILEAIKQCEVKDVTVVVLSEDFFTSRRPIVVSAVVLLYFVYLYYIGYIDRGGSTAGSSGSLDFRDIYISIVLFQAAYVWIKFRDVIPRGAVYHRRDSDKFEPRIKFPVTRGVGGKSKRVPLGLYDTSAEAEVVYRIAAFYCNKPKHRSGRLDLEGGASFDIRKPSLDPNLPYEEKVKQVGDQVLKAYAEFEEQKASRNLPSIAPQLAMEIPTEEGQLLATSPSQQLHQPLNSGMDSAMQDQGSHLAPSIHHGDDFNNPRSLVLLLVKTQHKLLEAERQNECLKAQLSRMKVDNKQLKQRNEELECVNLLLNEPNTQMQPQLQSHHQEQQLETNGFLSRRMKSSRRGDKVVVL